MKIVIIGNGKIGSNLAALLVQEGHDITVVDCDETHLRKSQNTLDVMCIEGNGATAETQLEAGANKATLLIAATPYDEVNVLCCLIGKRLGTKKTISRVRMPEYYQQMHLIREDLGLSMVINPELSTADEIMRVLVFPSAAKVEVFGKGKLELVEYRLPDFPWLENITLVELYKKIKTNSSSVPYSGTRKCLSPPATSLCRRATAFTWRLRTGTLNDSSVPAAS